MNQELQAVVFDMDGVLLDTERLFMESIREAAGKKQIDKIEKVIQKCIGLNKKDTKALFEKECGPEFLYEEYFSKCKELFDEKVESKGIPVKPGVNEVLTYLKSEGYKIALASSTNKHRVMEHLDKAGITDFFEVIIGGDMIKHGKPAPDIYVEACKRLGTTPENAIAVEDSPNGLKSAYEAGLRAVMVPDMIAPNQEIEELLYAKCDSLHEVKSLVMRMEGKLTDTERIPLTGLCNTRDLGGYRSADGRYIKPHKLIRSGALYDATTEDKEILVSEYDLKTIIDFRTAAERNLKPDPQLPGVAYIVNPILEEETMGITRESDGESDSNAVVKKVISAIQTGAGTPLAYMKEMYKSLIGNSYSKEKYKEFFRLLLDQEDGAVLWHCSAGKDRVGVGTILLLSALSIPREQIMEDYLKVNEFSKKEIDILMNTLTEHMDSEEEREQAEAVRLLFTVDRAYAESVFEEMEQEHGSVDAFLEKEMGLTPKKRRILCDKYLGEYNK